MITGRMLGGVVRSLVNSLPVISLAPPLPDHTLATAPRAQPIAMVNLETICSARPAGAKAMIRRHACLAHLHVSCSTCIERCPVPGAIVLRAGMPVIVQSACTGCGVCQDLCPAPVNAIEITSPDPTTRSK